MNRAVTEDDRVEVLPIVPSLDIAETLAFYRDYLGFETLTLAPIDVRPIELSLLTQREIDWLNAYHAQARETLGPLLDEPERQWLDEVTQAIG